MLIIFQSLLFFNRFFFDQLVFVSLLNHFHKTCNLQYFYFQHFVNISQSLIDIQTIKLFSKIVLSNLSILLSHHLTFILVNSLEILFKVPKIVLLRFPFIISNLFEIDQCLVNIDNIFLEPRYPEIHIHSNLFAL